MLISLFFGLFAIGIGLAIAFRGLGMFRILLPIWAFFVGLSMGGSAVAALLGGNLFSSIIGVGVGLGLGVILALFSYFAFGFAIMMLGASLGYQLGMGFMGLFGLASGFVGFVVAMSMAVIFALIFAIYRMPRLVVIGFTALVGAVTVISGVLVLLGVMSTNSVGVTATASLVSESSFLTALWLVLTVLGVVTQLDNEEKKAALFETFVIEDYR